MLKGVKVILDNDDYLQERYDAETQHSLSSSSQLRWNKTICDSLDMLEEYRAPEDSVYIRSYE